MTPPPTRRRKVVRLHRTQYEFVHSPASVRCFVGGRGAGKSFVACYDLIRKARRGRTYLVAAPTYPMLFDSEYRTFLKLGRELGVVAESRASPPSVRLSTGAEILFRSADDPDRLRGPNLSGAVLMEASLMERDALDVVLATLREGGEQGWLTAAMTPRGPTHWSYDAFASGKPGTALFRAPTYANPFLPPGFADTLRQQYDDAFAQQEIEGEFIDLEGAEWPAHYFRKEVWFEHWLPDSEYKHTVIGLDPSRGRDSKAGDYAAFVVARLDRRNVVWCDAVLVREDVPRLVDRLCGLAKQYPGSSAVVETNIGQELLVSEIRRRQVALGAMFSVAAYENRLPKVVRIRRLGPYLAHGHVRLRTTDGGRRLGSQLQAFPNGEHDDGPDSMELCVRRLEELENGPRR